GPLDRGVGRSCRAELRKILLRNARSDKDAPGPILERARRLDRGSVERQARGARAAGDDDLGPTAPSVPVERLPILVDIAGVVNEAPRLLVQGPGQLQRRK